MSKYANTPHRPYHRMTVERHSGHPAGTKLKGSGRKRRADHTMVGGVASMFFHEKRSRLA